MNAVRCEQVWKSFGAVDAVRDFEVTIEAGDILVLVGPSGCGKTTVLRLVAGFERPDAGRIAIDTRVVAAPRAWIPPERRHVGMVFQHHALFPHLTVGANVAYGLRGSRRQAQASAMLDLVGLGGFEGRMPHELSGGQQQRVALARALAPQPAVLLLDEPFSSLDADLRMAMRTHVRQILKHVGTTALFVTHDQEEALFMGDQVGVMRAGQLEQVAAPETLFRAPRTRFVAEFIGDASFVPARVEATGVRTELGFVTQHIETPCEDAEALVRPDDLTLEPAANGNGCIANRTFRGGEYVYEIMLDTKHIVRCVRNHVYDYPAGTRVQVRLEPGHPLVWFPSISNG
jgi:iron(III) transport system ATP-binding protein